MKRDTTSLLRELAELVERYPKPLWQQLAKLFEEKKSRSQLLLVLRGIACPEERTSRISKTEQIRRYALSRKRNSKTRHKEKHSEWLELELSRLPISDLRVILRRQGLQFSPKDSKQRLQRIIAKSGIERATLATKSLGERHSSDYAQWAEIIMGRNKREQPSRGRRKETS